MSNEIKTSIDELMKQAKIIQDNMQAAQGSLSELQITGKAGANDIQITLNGRHYCDRVTLDNSFLDEDKQTMEKLIEAAINDAVNKIEKATKEKMLELTAKLGLPPGMNLPG